jgi:DnaJ-class molecular chaperone
MEYEKIGKYICPKCKGNGYRRIWKDTSETQKIEIDCAACNNQGEIPFTTKDIVGLFKTRRSQ